MKERTFYGNEDIEFEPALSRVQLAYLDAWCRALRPSDMSAEELEDALKMEKATRPPQRGLRVAAGLPVGPGGLFILEASAAVLGWCCGEAPCFFPYSALIMRFNQTCVHVSVAEYCEDLRWIIEILKVWGVRLKKVRVRWKGEGVADLGYIYIDGHTVTPMAAKVEYPEPEGWSEKAATPDDPLHDVSFPTF